MNFRMALASAVALTAFAGAVNQKLAASPARPQVDQDDEPAMPKKRLEYRWETGKPYTYYIRRETEDGDKVVLQAGAATFTASDPGPRHEVDLKFKPTGTAFVIHPDGYLLTCAHCVEDAVSFEVAVGGKKYDGKVLGIDEDHDLALIQIPAKGLTALPLADSDKIEVGESVWVLGFPLASALGASTKATHGTISGVEAADKDKIFITDAAINPGNSGGPMVLENGDVIGVNAAKLASAEVSNVGFSVPVNYARSLLNKQKVTPVDATGGEPLKGTELVKRVSESCALVTITTVFDAQRFQLACKSRTSTFNRTKKEAENLSRKQGLREALAQPFECGSIIADAYGRVLETKLPKKPPAGTIDMAYQVIDLLPVHGKRNFRSSMVTELEFEVEQEAKPTDQAKGKAQPKTPEQPKSSANASTSKGTSPSTAPGGMGQHGSGGDRFGPFGPRASGGDPFGPFGSRGVGPRFGPSSPPHTPTPGGSASPANPASKPASKSQPATETKTVKKTIKIPLREEIVLNVSEVHGDQITVLRKFAMKTLDTRSDFPSLEIRGSGKTVFDVELGVPRRMDFKIDIVIAKGKDRFVQPVKTSYELIDESDLERFRRPEELAATELAGLIADTRNADKRMKALERLAKVAPIDEKSDVVVKAVEAVLTDKKEAVRSQAARVLAAWGNESGIPVWIKLLSDESDSVRSTAMSVLPGYPDERLAAAIAGFCVDGRSIFRGNSPAFDKLREMGPVAERPVIGLLVHQNATVRKQAIALLRTSGTEASVPELEKLARGDDLKDAKEAREALKAVCLRTGQPEPELPALPSEDAKIARNRSPRGDESADVPTAGATPRSTPSLGGGAGKSAVNPPATRGFTRMELGTTPESWLAVLQSGDNRQRREAAEKFAANAPQDDKPSREIAEALESLTTSDDVFLRRGVIKALGVWGTKESVPKLIGLLTHEDLFTQHEAIKSLGHFKDDKAVNAIAGRLSDLQSRHEASQALVAIGPRAEPPVLKLLDHKDQQIRLEAVTILRKIGTQKAIPALQAAANKDKTILGKRVEEAIDDIKRRAAENRTKSKTKS